MYGVTLRQSRDQLALCQGIGGLRQLTEDRISKNPKLIGRTLRPSLDQKEREKKEDSESNDAGTPNPTKPRPRLLFVLRVYVDGFGIGPDVVVGAARDIDP